MKSYYYLFLGFEYNSKNTIMTYDFWISIG